MALSFLAAAALLAVVDGEAALRHERALAALGPHPFGAPRTAFAAQYVAAELRGAGLGEVRLEEFESGGRTGRNVIGVLRAPGPAFVLIAAHHDSAPGGDGAGGGPAGVLIEIARALHDDPARPPRTLVFASFDAGAAQGEDSAAGAREWLRRQGADARALAGALVLGGAGAAGGTPTLHPLPRPDPLRPGRGTTAPGWLVQAALTGAAAAGAPFEVHGPLLGPLQQPLARAFRVPLPGGDAPLLEAGLPALLVSDGPPSISWREPGAAAGPADAVALARAGQALLGATRAVAARVAPPTREDDWFALAGHVVGPAGLWLAGALAVAPLLWRGRRVGGALFAARLLAAALFAILLWRHPVPALCALGPWLLALHAGPTRLALLLGAAPAAALAALATGAALRGGLGGSWLGPLDWAAALACGLLALVPLPATGGGGGGGARRAGRGRRAGLPGKGR